MGYIVMSSIVYFIMNMLGEMTTYLPVQGGSAQAAALHYSLPAVRRLLRYGLCLTIGYYQCLYDILPRFIYRLEFPCFLHCLHDLLRAVLQT